MKRTSDQEVQCDSDSKKLRLNGDTKMTLNDDEVDDEGTLSLHRKKFDCDHQLNKSCLYV